MQRVRPRYTTVGLGERNGFNSSGQVANWGISGVQVMETKATKIDWKSFRWSVALPLIMIVYVLAYIDRINISFAMGGMTKEMGVTSSAGGMITGVFFIGYTLLQLPAGHLASRSSARRNVMVLSVLWSLFSALQGCVHSVTQLVLVRFLLGTVEGGMFPSLIVLVANWFPPKERGRASGFFTFYLTLAPLVMSPTSGIILGHVKWLGWASWRWLFILEALPGIFVAIVFYCLVTDNPQDRKKLKPEEREYLVKALAEEAAQPKVVQDKAYWKAAFRFSFVFLTLGFFFRLIGNYGTQIWMPTIVKGISGFSDQTVGFILALPWLSATCGMVVTGWITDHYDCKKRLAVLEQIVAGLAFLVMYYYGGSNVWISVGCLIVAITGMASVAGIYYSLLPQLITKEMVGGLSGIFAAVSNIGGFIGPSVVGYLISGGNKLAGMAFLSGMLMVASICVALIQVKPASAPVKSKVASA